jgi:hypothetical protein
MTTLAKIEANRLNGQLSTGPRTDAGKAVVAQNATRHGIFSNVPVVLGECPVEWEAHRAGVVASLAPVGLLEVNLAERTALLLWRLQRLARYEAELVNTSINVVEVPDLPPPPDPFRSALASLPQKTREEQLRDIRAELRGARATHAYVVPARDYIRTSPESAGPAPFDVAETILDSARGEADAAENAPGNVPEFGGRVFMRKIGLYGSDARAVAWTPELIERGLAVYAGYIGQESERFRESVALELGEWAEELTRKVQRLEGEAVAVEQLLTDGTARQRASKLLPGGGCDERIAKYERHLHTLLTATLHELERLQARRDGESVAPPVVADLNVTVDARTG